MKSISSRRDKKEIPTSVLIYPDAQKDFDALVHSGNKKFNNALERLPSWTLVLTMKTWSWKTASVIVLFN